MDQKQTNLKMKSATYFNTLSLYYYILMCSGSCLYLRPSTALGLHLFLQSEIFQSKVLNGSLNTF